MASLDAAERVMAWSAGETPFAGIDPNELTFRSDSHIPAAMTRTAKVSGIFDDWEPPLSDQTTQSPHTSHEQAQGEQ